MGEPTHTTHKKGTIFGGNNEISSFKENAIGRLVCFFHAFHWCREILGVATVTELTRKMSTAAVTPTSLVTEALFKKFEKVTVTSISYAKIS